MSVPDILCTSYKSHAKSKKGSAPHLQHSGTDGVGSPLLVGTVPPAGVLLMLASQISTSYDTWGVARAAKGWLYMFIFESEGIYLFSIMKVAADSKAAW